ncbi:hypothetical protein BSL78_16060 [Apostichopus japonicus]|uniref:Uncharacterized protein n=1 Tax=Stichopus japonicus TaxID=307972 RepID=A0A2G8KGE5_STIJA|nr:hypothetical protein BSL78_16060 [Apostichopus japonicus]
MGNYSLTSLGVVEGTTDLNITWCSSNKDNFDNTCERTCENPNNCVIPDPADPERCLCPENHMILGDSCIPQEQCGCYVQGDGVVLSESETYINSDCSLRITCNRNVLTSERSVVVHTQHARSGIMSIDVTVTNGLKAMVLHVPVVDREIVLIYTQQIEEMTENTPFILLEAPDLKFIVKCLMGGGQFCNDVRVDQSTFIETGMSTKTGFGNPQETLGLVTIKYTN